MKDWKDESLFVYNKQIIDAIADCKELPSCDFEYDKFLHVFYGILQKERQSLKEKVIAEIEGLMNSVSASQSTIGDIRHRQSVLKEAQESITKFFEGKNE